MSKQIFKLSSILTAMYFIVPTTAQAHGWVEFPEARQSICYEQGGLWTGNPPNAACAAALQESGTYPFIQRNEVAINIQAPDYLDQNIVKAAIPDGSLCYANDSQKSGLGIAHSDWTRTEIAPGTFEFVFNATAPHNPSYWEIYLTKPGVDVSQTLKWDDLELIQEYGDITVGADKKYRMNVTIPADRSGDAVLYTRWQRIDPVGEGFYNCSDITITGDEQPPVDPDLPYLNKGEQFIPSDISINTPQIGELVKYDVLNQYGEVHNSFSIKITTDNQLDWDRLLASQISGYYETNHSGHVFIGDWHAEMNHYMYFRDNLHANYFNSKSENASGVFSIVAEEIDPQLKAVITPQALQEIEIAEVEHGTVVVLHPHNTQGEFDSVQWAQLSGPAVNVEQGLYSELMVNTEQLDSQGEHELSFRLTVSNNEGSDSSVYGFTVIGEEETPEVPPVEGDWDADKVYVEGDTVTFDGRTWTAKWWTQGEQPGTTGEWGVWR